MFIPTIFRQDSPIWSSSFYGWPRVTEQRWDLEDTGLISDANIWLTGQTTTVHKEGVEEEKSWVTFHAMFTMGGAKFRHSFDVPQELDTKEAMEWGVNKLIEEFAEGLRAGLNMNEDERGD